MAANNIEGMNDDRNARRRRRDFDTNESTSSNSINSTQRPRHHHDGEYPQTLSNGERVTIIPDWMPVMFKPPPQMFLRNNEEEVAAYIFMGSNIFDNQEILVSTDTGKMVGDRRTLKTIMPTRYLSNEVISLVACKLTHLSSLHPDYANCWFLPPQFSELALSYKKTPIEVSQDFRYTFMGYVDNIKKIFIPINDGGHHWILVVIDLDDENIWLLDSIFIEDMLMDRTFYVDSSFKCPVISDFSVTEPEGLSRNLTSYNDCGVQVSKWMMECVCNDNYESIQVNAEIRMRLALDLVLDRYNQKFDEVVNVACQQITN
ncbi:Ulp1 protease family, C-terminal catalytic domain [Sesbania bispinosa]|nr:Ulp1 protease family, C-terminal catalytic domain [Sesbania bispinosa]